MATTEQPKVASEEAKTDLFEDDDEFKKFDINRVWDGKEEGKELAQQREDDWDVNNDFSLQLKKELENNADKKFDIMSMNWAQRKIFLYNVTFGLYMLDPWERYLFNALVIVLMWFIFYNGYRNLNELCKRHLW